MSQAFVPKCERQQAELIVERLLKNWTQKHGDRQAKQMARLKSALKCKRNWRGNPDAGAELGRRKSGKGEWGEEAGEQEGLWLAGEMLGMEQC